ncbi:MAG: DUF4363 family protein [Clostridia bacterium]|nr:DUF4363 family protein [Clostridia bacterium]
MRRALILITLITLICFGSGHYFDRLRERTAHAYLQDAENLRQLVLAEQWHQAQSHERLLTARWQHDVRWLKILISHHHVREIDAALLRLSTSLTHHWPDEALPALDDLYSALQDLRLSHLPTPQTLL